MVAQGTRTQPPCVCWYSCKSVLQDGLLTEWLSAQVGSDAFGLAKRKTQEQANSMSCSSYWPPFSATEYFIHLSSNHIKMKQSIVTEN